MLCEICRNISFRSLHEFWPHYTADQLPASPSFKQTSRGPFYYPHQASALKLQQSARAGCPFCAQIEFAFKFYRRDRLLQNAPTQIWLYYILTFDEKVPRALMITCPPAEFYSTSVDIVLGMCFSLYLMPLSKYLYPPGADQSAMIPDPLTDLHTGSDANPKMARQWLDECDQNHPACLSSQQSSHLPSRVVDISCDHLFSFTNHPNRTPSPIHRGSQTVAASRLLFEGIYIDLAQTH